MRILRFVLPLVVLLQSAAPANAEITWTTVDGSFELSGAELFRLRKEIGEDQRAALDGIRNVAFPSNAAFRDALAAAGISDSALVDRLVGIAAGGAVSLGYEHHGPGIVTLHLDDADPSLDGNPFTSRSWLPAIADEAGPPTLDLSFKQGCLAVSEQSLPILEFCLPSRPDGSRVAAIRTSATHVLGLGQEFQVPGDTTVERAGFVRHGHNVMEGFNGGANGNTLIPIAYFEGAGRPFALVLDNRYSQQWDLSTMLFEIRADDGDVRLHVITGETLADVRRRFMALSGHPPVPPKAMFGLWLSEYGFDDWAELDEKLASLSAAGFPVSGVVLDLQWFGGIDDPTGSRMGSLTWDTEAFPNPKARIAELAERGIGVMLIEESYVDRRLPEYEALAREGALVHDGADVPVVVNPAGNWWGRGGMIDWTEETARAFWHDYRRQALIEDGILGHWTDLGEPEMVNPAFVYGNGLSGAQVGNSYNLLWLQGIYEGYLRNSPERRQFMMSRSGGMGMQAFGAAMWSGDTGSDFGSLAAQMPQQTHMMWSGIDYYGFDVGGFHRKALGIYPGDRDAVMDELYTQWLAYAALFEVPVRPHTENLCNCKQTAPDRIGDRASNYEALMLRRTLLPYYYSLAHRAWLAGEPVFPSLEYAYPGDRGAARLGHVKMIGSELVAAAVSEPGAQAVDVYLPEGTWFDLRTLDRVVSAGTTITQPLYDHERVFRLPVFAKDGAILPMETELGLQLAVFGNASNRFDWFDDDGVSTAYQRGDYEHVEVVLEPDTLSLVRRRGNRLAPLSLHWQQPGGTVRDVLVDGVSAPFALGPLGIEIELPRLEKTMKIELVR